MGGYGPLGCFNVKTDQDTDSTRKMHTLPVTKQMKSGFSIVTQGECPSQASNTQVGDIVHHRNPTSALSPFPAPDFEGVGWE